MYRCALQSNTVYSADTTKRLHISVFRKIEECDEVPTTHKERDMRRRRRILVLDNAVHRHV